MLKVNGKAYDWADVDVKFPGLVLQLQEISYDDEQEKVHFSKRSNKASQGDKSLTVDIDLMIVGGIIQDGVKPV